MNKVIEIKLPRILQVIDTEQAIEDIKTDKYLVILIPIEDILE